MKTHGLTKSFCYERLRQQRAAELDKSGNLSKKKGIKDKSTEQIREVLNREPPENPIISLM